jgi:zinc transport system permease protein
MFLPQLLADLPPYDPDWLERAITAFNRQFPDGTFFSQPFNVSALLALVLVSLSCGAVGSLVVGSRMAFFSDALAHCAFAGVSVGFLLFEVVLSRFVDRQHFWQWVTPVMVAFGVLVGYGIAAVRLRTNLTSDTVIGVFFAGAIGLAAMLRKLMYNRRDLFNLEDFLFGDPLLVRTNDLVMLAVLAVLTFAVLAVLYNPLLLTSFNSSLALSRRAPVRLSQYAFIMLLAVIVNLCLRSVGALLINALLVVPAASAANLCGNLRQLFRWTLVLCLLVSVGGQALSWTVEMHFLQQGRDVRLGIPGTIILLSVVLFAASMVVAAWRRRPARGQEA